MIYEIELHDAEVANLQQGTLLVSIGRGGRLDAAYQVEMWLQEILAEESAKPWRRAYAKANGLVVAVWVRDISTADLRYVARDPSYPGEWVLPFVGSEQATIVNGVWGHDAVGIEEAVEWAGSQLIGSVGTAVLREEGQIAFAWERIEGEVRLIARGPRQLLILD